MSLAGGNVNVKTTLENSLEVSYVVKHTVVTYDSATPLLWIYQVCQLSVYRLPAPYSHFIVCSVIMELNPVNISPLP